MKKDRKDLEKNLIVILERISGDENKMHIITDIMMQHGILPGEAAKMTEQPTSISLLDVNVLYLFTNALFEATKEIIIKPEDWFTEIQIAEGKAFQIYEDDKITEIVLHNVTYNGNKHWVCPRISGKELYSFIQHRLLGYDPQMQRPTIKFVTLETMGELPDIRTYKTSQITKQILNREFVGNTISLNIKKTGFEEYSYDEETMTLVIPIKVENSIVIIDGAHRIIGNAKAYQLDPNIDINWSLNIFNYDVKEARKFIKQEGKATPLSKKDLRFYGSDDANISIAQDINAYESAKTNFLFNKLAENPLEVEYRDKFTTIDLFAKSIKYSFKYNKEDPYEIQKIRENLVRGINEILGYLRHKYGDFDRANEKYAITESNIFIGYVALLAKLWNQKSMSFARDWDIALHDMLDKIDFTRDNPDWDKIALMNSNINVTTIGKISNYFIAKGDESNGDDSEVSSL